jgi:hypothetical protein
MHDLAEVARLRSDVPAARTDRALARLTGAIAVAGASGADTRRPAGFTARLGPPGHRIRNLAIAATAVVALAAATAITAGQAGRTGAERAAAAKVTPAPPGTWWTYTMPSQGVATSAAKLVAYATKAAAKAPLFPVPKPTDWYYTETLAPGNGGESGLVPTGPDLEQTWQQIGSSRAYSAPGNGKLSYNPDNGPGAGLMGWPGNWTTMYRYLAHLPASIPALKAVILYNVGHDHPANLPPAAAQGLTFGAFTAIEAILEDLAVPLRLQAELYGVLVGLPGVRFDRSATDGAGRAGVGLYVIQGGWSKYEIIVNPRTYAYMGNAWIAVRAYTQHCSGMCWPKITHYRKGQIINWSAQLAQGIVQRAGQLPRR